MLPSDEALATPFPPKRRTSGLDQCHGANGSCFRAFERERQSEKKEALAGDLIEIDKPFEDRQPQPRGSFVTPSPSALPRGESAEAMSPPMALAPCRAISYTACAAKPGQSS